MVQRVILIEKGGKLVPHEFIGINTPAAQKMITQFKKAHLGPQTDPHEITAIVGPDVQVERPGTPFVH